MTDEHPSDFGNLTDLEVLRRWSEVMTELRRRGMIWSGKSPVADYAEYLVARHYGVEPLRGANPGYDLVTKDGHRVQVKSRRYTAHSTPGHFGEFSKFMEGRFDELVVVLFEDDLRVRVAYRVSYEWVRERAKARGEYHRLTIKAVLDEAETVESLHLDQS